MVFLVLFALVCGWATPGEAFHIPFPRVSAFCGRAGATRGREPAVHGHFHVTGWGTVLAPPRSAGDDGAAQVGTQTSQDVFPPQSAGGDDAAQGVGAQAPQETGAPEETNAVFELMTKQFLEACTDSGKNLTELVDTNLDMCDFLYLEHLNGKIKDAGPESKEGRELTEVAVTINTAMQHRLVRADKNLREILSQAPEIKKMEGALKRFFLEGQIDMAFMVMINMNLVQAKEAQGAENAVMILTHLNTVIMEMQDERVAPEVKLLRRLLRADCEGVRENLLKEKLVLPGMDLEIGMPMDPPQDEGAVLPQKLQQAIAELAEQASPLGQTHNSGLVESLQGLATQVDSVVAAKRRRPGPFRTADA